MSLTLQGVVSVEVIADSAAVPVGLRVLGFDVTVRS